MRFDAVFTRSRRYLLACVLFATTTPALADYALYINYAPDARYSSGGHDARIAIDADSGRFIDGHNLGNTSTCAEAGTKCLVLGFMGLYSLPENAAVGSRFVAGDYEFTVSEEFVLSLLGNERLVHRVEVTKQGEPANAYLFDPELGVVAILVRNFSNKDIPESVYLLSGRSGVFHRRATGAN